MSIEKLDTNDGRYVTLINKINEIIDELNLLSERFEMADQSFSNHTHDGTTTPMITMVDEREL